MKESKRKSATQREKVARSLFNQAVTLRELGHREEEIAAYDEIDRRYGADETPAVRAKVAEALVKRG